MKMFIFLSLALSVMSQHSAAGPKIRGTEGGNGGDSCENRINQIRDDIVSWIDAGGADNLKLPEGVAKQDYIAKMKDKLANAKVSCVERVMKLGRSEKTCMNDVVDGEALIECNIARVASTLDSQLYVLTHHEYAGLAGLEANKTENSHYELSEQLTDFLEQQVVTRLAVRPASDNKNLLSCENTYFSGFDATVDRGNVNFTARAFGYADRLEIAPKLGLLDSDKFSDMQFKIPLNQCNWESVYGRISCYTKKGILIFKNAAGRVEVITDTYITVATGLVGLGPNSVQTISLKVEFYKGTVYENFSYPAQARGGDNAGWFVCGRRAN